jgi:Cytochrome bd terminal oxidase subunit II
MILLWTAALALTMLLYVLLDGFDLGVGILFGFTRDEQERRRMLARYRRYGTAMRRGSSSQPPFSLPPFPACTPLCSVPSTCP